VGAASTREAVTAGDSVRLTSGKETESISSLRSCSYRGFSCSKHLTKYLYDLMIDKYHHDVF
jgi:hypothetical protein